MSSNHDPKIDPSTIIQTFIENNKSIHSTARSLGINRNTVRKWVSRLDGNEIKASPKPYEIAPLPEDDIPIEQLVELRKRQFRHKREYEEASKLIPVKVNLRGPIGLLHFGDPHVDDDGTDIEALERHTDLCRITEGMFACNVGDTTNNWVGRLARLYAEQSTSAAQAWKLAEWFIKRSEEHTSELQSH